MFNTLPIFAHSSRLQCGRSSARATACFVLSLRIERMCGVQEYRGEGGCVNADQQMLAVEGDCICEADMLTHAVFVFVWSFVTVV